MTDTHPHATECQWCRGYEEQTAWLAGKSVAQAEQALTARVATLGPDPYNEGGTVAVRDYIADQHTESEPS